MKRPKPRITKPADLAVVVIHNVDPLWPAADQDAERDTVNHLIKALMAEGLRVFDVPVTDADLAAALAPFDPGTHIVFNWCEELPGIPRSDAQVAELLELLGYAYSGSPPDVLSLTWDKAAVKALLTAHGVPTPCGRVMESATYAAWHRFPAIVKPAFEHCSVGIDGNAVVLDQEGLRKQVAHIREAFAQPALVEDFIDGREFHVTLYGNGRTAMLPPAEMDFSAFPDVRDRLCTFDSKFTPGSRHYDGIGLLVPAAMGKTEMAALRRASTAAYRVLGCRDYARIDVRLRDETFYILDVNPNADISLDTSLAYVAEAAGMSYGAFAKRLVRLAGARHPGRHAARTPP